MRRSFRPAPAISAVHFGPLGALLILIAVFAAHTLIGFTRGVVPSATAFFLSPAWGGAAARAEAFLPHLLLLWAMAGAGLAHGANRFGTRRFRRLTLLSELRVQKWFSRFGLLACSGVFLFSLARSWAEVGYTRRSGAVGATYPRYSALFGFLPWSDAHAYYTGANHLVDVGKLDSWNERRPLNATLLAVRLGLARFDLRAATILQVLLLAACTFLAGLLLARRLGVWVGIGMVALVLPVARLYQSTTLSEALGMTLGALSVGLLYDGIVDRNAYVAAAGLGAMCLGMGARPGALLLVPAVLLALFLGRNVFQVGRWKAVTAAGLAALLGLSWTPLLNREYGTGAGMVSSNFADVTCGLALGGSWVKARERYARELTSLANEREKALFLYRETVRLVRQNPRPMLESLRKHGAAFVFNLGPFFRGLVIPSTGGPLAVLQEGILVCWVVWYLAWGCRPGELGFWIAGWIGVLLSAPFIFGDGGWRAFATTWPFCAASVAVGLGTGRLREVADSFSPRRDGARLASCLCLAFLAMTPVVGPKIVRALSSRPDVRGFNAAGDGGKLVIIKRPERDPAVGVVDRGEPGIGGIPSLEFDEYQRRLNEIAIGEQTLLSAPSRPFLLLWSYDYIGHWTFQLAAPPELLAASGKWQWLKIEPWGESKRLRRVVAFGDWEPRGLPAQRR